MPYWRMRLIGFLLSPWNFLAFNEAFGHFMLRPRSFGTMLRHMLWRTRNFLVWEFRPRGTIYTFLWRLWHPWAFLRPLAVMLARISAVIAAFLKRILPAGSPAVIPSAERPPGISVVIPSRNGKDLLARGLPEVVRQIGAIGGEVIVVDNGSNDGTADFLRRSYPAVVIVERPRPLSFSRAVNAGIQVSLYSHVCLLNNDMVVEEGFFNSLRSAFDGVPDLFCATAQIFFPEGVRREETGKAVMPFASDRAPRDFPLRCDLPSEGEDSSYVLYGSGGCSLFDARKLLFLGALDEAYEPAYVEDLDLGFRAWEQGWPSVFVAGARVVHEHRATTSRYYSSDYLDRVLEVNYLHFIARAVSDPKTFRRLWREAIHRLNLRAALQEPNRAAVSALARAWLVPFWVRRRPPAILDGSEVLALGSGAITVIPGRKSRGAPVIAVASPYLPFPLSHGGAVRMFNLMRRAVADFDQVLIAFADAPAKVPEELLDICCEVVLVTRTGTHLIPSTSRPDIVEEFDSPAFHAALRQTVRKWKPAVVQLEFTQMAQYAGDCAPAKSILVEHDVTIDLYQQLLRQGDDWELRYQLDRWLPFETKAWHSVDRVVTMSETDSRWPLDAHVPAANVVSLANGVDLGRFRPSGVPPEPRRLLFIGSFAHLPNVLAMDFFLSHVWPLLGPLHPTLHVIAGSRHRYFLDRCRGQVQLNLDLANIEVEDFVADVRPAYGRAAVVIAPLLASAGTNIKIMEAMAMGKAIVSTSGGVHGLSLHPGSDILVADQADDMARAIAELIEHPSKRECIEREARRTVERDFDWDVIAGQQKKLYLELLGQPSRVAKAT
jgi:GT2 family glycosyltransferase/glycosyltransferase involved in cell wall biosynthesis